MSFKKITTDVLVAIESRSGAWLKAGRWLLVLLLLWALVHQLGQMTGSLGWAAFWPDGGYAHRWGFGVAAVLLMFVNWSLEATKWHYLMRAMGLTLPLGEVWRAVLAGISFSVITPNRMGEYAGRMLVVAPDDRWVVALSSLAGSWCQWMAFLSIGWPSLWAWVGRHYQWPAAWVWPLALLGPLAVWILTWSWDYWRSHPMPGRLKRIPLRPSWKTFLAPVRSLKEISGHQLRMAGLLASIRFGVYCFQYWLVLHFLGLNLDLAWGFSGIAAIYMVQAGLPLPPGAGLLTRAELALMLWGDGALAQAAILSGTLLLFVINLGLPALLGMWFIVKKS